MAQVLPPVTRGRRRRDRGATSGGWQAEMVDLTHSPETIAFRDELTAWLDAELPAEWRVPGFWTRVPEAEAFELRRGFERRKAEAGFAGIQWPTEYGGRGGTPAMKAAYDEVTRRYRVPETVNSLGLTFLAPTLIALGTEEQKREILPPMLRGDVIWVQGFSEPGAGSDLAALRCRGELDGDEYVINGQKTWTTNGAHGDRIFALVRTSAEDSRHSGISMLLVDLDQPGIDVRPLKQLSGASEFCEVFFTDARCPVERNLGGIGNGWDTAMLLLSFERGSSAIGQYTEFRDDWDQIAQLAHQRGRAADPVIRQRLGHDLTELECLKYLSWHVLTEVEAQRDLGYASSMTKLQWSETYQDLWETFHEVLGADAMDAEDPVVKAMQRKALWSRSVTIWGGSSQIQRNVIAERVLGLPR
jgi:alkylation response protein AidB-like acyl-CoA dehydrogenase